MIYDPEMGFIQPGGVLPGGAMMVYQEATAPGGRVECGKSKGLLLLGDSCLCYVEEGAQKKE